jgi:multiple sugar transport system permease protein
MKRHGSLASLSWRALFALACLGVVLITLFPFTIMATTALKTRDEILNTPQTWLPQPVAWDNFLTVWEFWAAVPLARLFANSAIVASGATLLTLALVIPAAYAMAKAHFAGRQVMSLLLLTLQMFSPVVIILPLYRIMLRLHLLNTYWALILMDSLFLAAFAAWLLMGFFAAVPRDVERAAIMDGCSRGQLLWRIFLPLAAPGLVVTAIYCFIGAWNEFFFAYTFTSSDQMNPLMVGIYRLRSASFLDYKVQWHYMMAMSLYSILPPIVLFTIIRRYLIRGLTAGAVKQ